LMLSTAELSSISSTIVREIIRGKGKIDKFVPKQIIKELIESV
jgi:phosphopantetheine adenylyltransferase